MKKITIYKYEYDINTDTAIHLRKISFIPSYISDDNAVMFGCYKPNSGLISISLNVVILGKNLYMLERNDEYALNAFKGCYKSYTISAQNRIRSLNKEITKLGNELKLYASKIDAMCISEEDKSRKA